MADEVRKEAPLRDSRELRVWGKAHDVVLAISRGTENFPPHELYGRAAQMRQASTSIPATIAEGTGRGTDAEMARYLRIAMGSAAELDYSLLLARDLGYLTKTTYNALHVEVTDVRRMLNGTIQQLRAAGERRKANGERRASEGLGGLGPPAREARLQGLD